MNEHLLVLLVLHLQLPFLPVFLLGLHFLAVLERAAHDEALVEAKIFGEGLQHELLVVVPAPDAILEHLVLFLERLLELLFVDVAGWFVMEGVDLLEELDVLLYEVVRAGVQLVGLLLVFLEEDQQREVLPAFIDLEQQLPALVVGPVGVLDVRFPVEVVVVIYLVVLLPRQQEGMYPLVLLILLHSQPKVVVDQLQLEGLTARRLESLLETCEHLGGLVLGEAGQDAHLVDLVVLAQERAAGGVAEPDHVDLEGKGLAGFELLGVELEVELREL